MQVNPTFIVSRTGDTAYILTVINQIPTNPHMFYVDGINAHTKILRYGQNDTITMAKEYGIKDVKTISREGNAAAEILHVADEENVDTIVIGSKGVKSIKEFLLGGVSYKVVHHAKCPSNQRIQQEILDVVCFVSIDYFD